MFELTIDSGAFSSWTKKQQVDIQAYADFCLANTDVIDNVVNLDVIPGEFGKKNLTKDDIELSAETGYRNYEYMLSRGIDPTKLIHVYHQGEDFKWLRRMVKEMPYIGLSPANDRTTEEKMLWLDRCMEHVLDADGYPTVRFHGFAVTSVRLVTRYPWYSVDSATWSLFAVYGAILVPSKTRGLEPFIVHLSNRATNTMREEGKHFVTYPQYVQEYIIDYLSSIGFKLGQSEFREEAYPYELKDGERFAGRPKKDATSCTVETVLEDGVVNNTVLRRNVNAIFFADFERSLPDWPWAYRRKSNRLGLVEQLGVRSALPACAQLDCRTSKIFFAGNAHDFDSVYNLVTGRGNDLHFLVSFFYKSEADKIIEYKRSMLNGSKAI